MTTIEDQRERLLAGLPVRERRVELAGVTTALLEGGDGPALVLLHGPGEFAATWSPVLTALVQTNRVVVPDLPGHGASALPRRLDAESVLDWLVALIEQTCPTPPVIVGRVTGGAIGARFAIEYPGQLAELVLVDTTGLTAFAPDARFGLALHRFLAAPSTDTYHRLMDFCAFDLDGIRGRLGSRWDPLAGYAVELAAQPGVQAATGSLIAHFGARPIPDDALAGITVPTTLIWGRNDLATPLSVAEGAAARFGWPLHVIDSAGDDPPLDQPEAFLDALHAALGSVVAR